MRMGGRERERERECVCVRVCPYICRRWMRHLHFADQSSGGPSNCVHFPICDPLKNIEFQVTSKNGVLNRGEEGKNN